MVKKNIFRSVFYLTALCLVTGCLGGKTSFNSTSLVGPPTFKNTGPSFISEPAVSYNNATTHPDYETPGYSQRIYYESASHKQIEGVCNIQERFDDSGLLAFYSDDRTRRFSLHTGGMEEAVLRYSFKLGGNKVTPQRVINTAYKSGECAYDSRVQGIIGSLYHELNGTAPGVSAQQTLRERLNRVGF